MHIQFQIYNFFILFSFSSRLFTSYYIIKIYLPKKGQMSKIRRLFDFCNAKYQGQAIKNHPDGFGILLDDNFTLLLSQWKAGKITNPSMAIFEDSLIAYGDFHHQQSGIIVYSNLQCMIYEYGENIAVDLFQSGYLLKLGKKVNEKSKKHTNQPNFQIVEQKVYKNVQQKAKILEQILGAKVPQHYKSFQTFVKESFKKTQLQIPNPSKMIQNSSTPKKNIFIHPRTVYNLSFKKASIYLKLLEKDQRVLDIGYSSEFGVGESQISRTYHYNSIHQNKWTIKQNIQNHPIQQFEYFDPIHQQQEQIREKITENKTTSQQIDKNQAKMKQLKKQLRNYFKSSLSFVNKYIDLTDIYQLKKKNLQIRRFLKKVVRGRYGQNQIQMAKSIQKEVLKNYMKDKNTAAREVSTEDLKSELQRVKRIGSRSPATNKSQITIHRDHSQLEPSRMKESSFNYSPIKKFNRDKQNQNHQRSLSRSVRPKNKQIDRYKSKSRERNQKQQDKNNGKHSQIQRLKRARQSEIQFEKINSFQQDEKANYSRYTPNKKIYRQSRQSFQAMQNSQLNIKNKVKENSEGKYEFAYNRGLQKKQSAKQTRYSYLQKTNRNHQSPKKSEDLNDLIGTYKNIDSEIKRQTPRNNKNNVLDNIPLRFNYLQDAETPRYLKITGTSFRCTTQDE